MVRLFLGGLTALACILAVAVFVLENAGRTVTVALAQHLLTPAVSAVLMTGVLLGLVFALAVALVLGSLSGRRLRHDR